MEHAIAKAGGTCASVEPDQLTDPATAEAFAESDGERDSKPAASSRSAQNQKQSTTAAAPALGAGIPAKTAVPPSTTYASYADAVKNRSEERQSSTIDAGIDPPPLDDTDPPPLDEFFLSAEEIEIIKKRKVGGLSAREEAKLCLHKYPESEWPSRIGMEDVEATPQIVGLLRSSMCKKTRECRELLRGFTEGVDGGVDRVGLT